MEVLQEQQGNQGCPNLNAKSILGGSDESFYLQVLFEGLEKHLAGKGLARCIAARFQPPPSELLMRFPLKQLTRRNSS
jgi:hypothetical protein